MRLKNIPGSREVIAENEYVIHDETAHKGKWREIFIGFAACSSEDGGAAS